MQVSDKEHKDMEKEKIKSQLSTLKPALMLHESERGMLADLLVQIDFRVCDNDLEVLQLFFKRVYSGIEALKKERTSLKQELEDTKKQMEIQANLISDLHSEVERLKLTTKEDCLKESAVSPV